MVKLAPQLKKMEVPILLTVQLDSVGRGDKVISSNVSRAANLFQQDGLIIKGEREIRPEDGRRRRSSATSNSTTTGRRLISETIPNVCVTPITSAPVANDCLRSWKRSILKAW